MEENKHASGVQFFNPTKLLQQQQEETDGSSMISLLLCSAGMFLRYKLIIWISIFFILSSMCRKKYSSPSTQFLINGVMVIFGLISTYVLHAPAQPVTPT